LTVLKTRGISAAMRLRLTHLTGCAVAAALCSSDDQQNQWQNGNFDPAQ